MPSFRALMLSFSCQGQPEHVWKRQLQLACGEQDDLRAVRLRRPRRHVRPCLCRAVSRLPTSGRTPALRATSTKPALRPRSSPPLFAGRPFELYYAPPTPGVYAQFKCNSNDSNALVSVCSTSACDDCGDFATLAPAGMGRGTLCQKRRPGAWRAASTVPPLSRAPQHNSPTQLSPLPDTCVALGQNTPGSFDVQCVASDEAKNKVLGIIFLVINCGSMAVYVLLQKRFVFDKSPERKLDPLDLGRWTAYPITVTSYRYGAAGEGERGRAAAARTRALTASCSWPHAHARSLPPAPGRGSYFFGAMFMAATAGIRYAINGDSSVFVIPKATFGGLAYAVFVSSALCCALRAGDKGALGCCGAMGSRPRLFRLF